MVTQADARLLGALPEAATVVQWSSITLLDRGSTCRPSCHRYLPWATGFQGILKN